MRTRKKKRRERGERERERKREREIKFIILQEFQFIVTPSPFGARKR